MTQDGKGNTGEQDDQGRTGRHQPESCQPVCQPDPEITQERQGAGVSVRAVSVGTQDPIADEPDRERYQDQTGEQSQPEDNQLSYPPRPIGE